MGVVFLLSEDAAEQWLYTEGGKDAGGQAATIAGFRVRARRRARSWCRSRRRSRKKAPACGVSIDFAGGHGDVGAGAEMIAEEDETIGMAKGNGRRRMPSTSEKTAMVAPMPKARVRMTVAVKAGDLRSWRRAKRRFWTAWSSQTRERSSR